MCGCANTHFGELCPNITRNAERARWKSEQACINACLATPQAELELLHKLDLTWLLRSKGASTKDL